MTVGQFTNLIVTIALIEMMISIGLGVTVSDLVGVARNWRLTVKAALANYLCVPAAAVGLLLLFRTPPMTAAGFLILAVCPGAPFGPPLTGIAKGDVTTAVGLMVLLAGSSALLAPLLLGLLLPVMAGNHPLNVDPLKLAATLLVTQLFPLGVGLTIRNLRPESAKRLLMPADRLSKILGLLACGLIIGTQYQLLSEIRPRGVVGMLLLLIASFGAGWAFGGPETERRKAMTLTTSLRNVGVGLVIATGNFAGTPAVTAVLAYGLFEIIGSLLLALWWGRQCRRHSLRGDASESRGDVGSRSDAEFAQLTHFDTPLIFPFERKPGPT
jgi:BASS family bile acid:Na+ symporter